MKVKDVIDDAGWLKITDLDNFFTVHIDNRGNYMYNLNEGVYIDVPDSMTNVFICDQKMHWPLISYKLYGTTRLAWLLMKINKVGADQMFDAKYPTDEIKYIDKDMIQSVIKTINDYED